MLYDCTLYALNFKNLVKFTLMNTLQKKRQTFFFFYIFYYRKVLFF